METVQIVRDQVWVVVQQTQTQTILDYAYAQGWDKVRVAGKGGKIDHPVESKGWLIMPENQFTGIIPPDGKERMERVKETFGISHFLIADDPRHPRYQVQKRDETREKLILRAKRVGLIALGVIAIPFVAAFIGLLAIAAVTTVMMVISLAISVLALPILAMGALGLAFDPLIIAVTEEGDLVCIYEWQD